jgi:hypothetical protein
MQPPKKISKTFASALHLAYERALKARDKIEHRLITIPRQTRVVRDWTEDLLETAARQYPGHDVSSYPVQTRMQRDIETLERYQTELQDALISYSSALKEIDTTIEYIITATNSNSLTKETLPWLAKPEVLIDDPWPQNWPPCPDISENKELDNPAYYFNLNLRLPPPRPPSPTIFTLDIAETQIILHTRYEEGIEPFKNALEDFFSYDSASSSSRWPAIVEATRCGIRWPLLDRYLAECKHPWLPTDFVNAEFGLRGTLARRDQLADVLAKVSPDAGRWYLSSQPGRSWLRNYEESHCILEELVVAGLVQWGPKMPPGEMLREIPFTEVKSLFALATLSLPRSFNNAVARYEELVNAYGTDSLLRKISTFVDNSEVFEVLEVDGWDREERLGPRARANVLVSTLVLLYEGDTGPLQIIEWKG